ncbi:MATE family efflux transporter [Bacteroidales bacterium OttesenSCG-928-K03]|nr:MATE family efflux transporter [Odoribacter sp. OttesenSCG-928-L07]MDL2239434.1 MATE family efflux transporter [Bacteroidales bacterium OttesenSCG-928-L14]MDL2241100.1 MATE family efflux transporter [Bacteroidales bacterium OttesenSCG-928-K22]MDL2242223.1 MATE family efflux transporter [Bacteroidales bacterium OttesenSCG-928-K03]
MNKKILNLAIPNIITNITVPLLGMVDLAIVGHIGDEKHIGAIALGTMIFNLIYWNFGFLRMGTSGFTAQAYGANDTKECLKILVRGSAIAVSIATLLILLQSPVGWLSGKLIKGSEDTINLALSYFYIRIWAAPATLGLYVLKGWFIGMQNAKYPMIVAITLNVVNIIFSLIFAVVLKLGIRGVAMGTVLAQYSGLIIAIILWIKKYGYLRKDIEIKESLKFQEMKTFFKVNSDIFLRTLCLVAVFTFIPAISASMGDRILAVNTLLMQLFTLFSYIMDGFAYAGEALVGKYIGAKDNRSLQQSVKLLLRWGIIITIAFTLIYLFWGRNILSLLTNNREVINTAMEYIIWSLLVPICGFAAFLFDGIYIGATESKTMRNSMFIATAVFFILYFVLINTMGNNGLWIAFLFYLAFRGGLLWLMAPKKIKVS